MIKIDKNVPIPPAGQGRPRKYPFDEMDVGDSFFSGSIASVESSAYSRNDGKKFVLRKVRGGVRVWRVE